MQGSTVGRRGCGPDPGSRRLCPGRKRVVNSVRIRARSRLRSESGKGGHTGLRIRANQKALRPLCGLWGSIPHPGNSEVPLRSLSRTDIRAIGGDHPYCPSRTFPRSPASILVAIGASQAKRSIDGQHARHPRYRRRSLTNGGIAVSGSKRSVASVFPPGDFIREELEARGWTQRDLAEILGRPIQAVNAIVNGKKEITP